MPEIALPEVLAAEAERLVETGLYADLSDVVQAALRRLMEDEAAFAALRRELAEAMHGPTEIADLRTLLLAPRG